MSSTLLTDLNEEQRKAVQHDRGPCLVISGAGSGKTRVLTSRIAYLVDVQGVDPFRVLALTFTNKAAREMQQRVVELAGLEAHNLWIGTFHSLFTRILRREASLLGYTSSFTIYDRDDALAVAKEVLRGANISVEKCNPKALLRHISYAKQSRISWRAFLQEEGPQSTQVQIGPLYKTYVERTYKANAMDFDDLIFNMYLLCRDFPEALARYQSKFQHLLIDEFQDTNETQYLIARQLAHPEDNIYVVGDDSQSIYAFRGASIENILNFQNDYSQSVLIRLEQNYRSTACIIEAAGSLIAKNIHQIPKKIWTENSTGAPLQLLQAQNDNEEGRLVSSAIFEQQHSFGCKNSEIAILYRTHSQSRALEEALRRIQIPYRIYGGLSFYQRKEVKDLLSYLRFITNAKDEAALLRIINLPKRGIGDTTLQKMRLCAANHDMSLWEVMQAGEQLLDSRTQQLISPFVMGMSQFIAEVAEPHNAYELSKEIAQKSGLLAMHYEDRSPEGVARYENIQELLNGIRAFTEESEREDNSLETFLQEVALITDIDRPFNTECVQLMTIHTAKGLEFRVVFVVGLEENLFPSQRVQYEKKELEEERRLFYVAMTRAKERLFLSYARQRYMYGGLRISEPSRFLSEIDSRHFSYVPKREFASVVEPKGDKLRVPSRGQTTRLKPVDQLRKEFQSSNLEQLATGMQVEHRLFGTGKVLDVIHGDNPRARIHFSTHGEKTLLLQYARLKIIH